jgi:hypothetical protein
MAKTPTQIASLARAHTAAAINCLVGIMENGASEPAKVTAAQALLDRGWGKAAQPHDGDGEGGPVQVNITWQSGK